jgi:hypothetical protein
MAHEKSITVQNEAGKFVNLDSVHGGKQQPESVLLRWLKDKHLKPLGGKQFNSASEAVEAAKKRSKSFGKP